MRLLRIRKLTKGNLKMKPCINCALEIDSDIWEEELGLCLECSNAYFNHEIDLVGK